MKKKKLLLRQICIFLNQYILVIGKFYFKKKYLKKNSFKNRPKNDRKILEEIINAFVYAMQFTKILYC